MPPEISDQIFIIGFTSGILGALAGALTCFFLAQPILAFVAKVRGDSAGDDRQ